LYASTTGTLASPNRHAEICSGAGMAGNPKLSGTLRPVAVRQLSQSEVPESLSGTSEYRSKRRSIKQSNQVGHKEQERRSHIIGGAEIHKGK
jgi:hypothetical protein